VPPLTLKTTHLIIGINVLIYGLMLAMTGFQELAQFSLKTMVLSGALYSPLVREGQVWRLLTAMFLHFDPAHILLNMVALYQAGSGLERYYGRRRFVVIYLLAGLGGSLASLAASWAVPVVAAGASGAITGLIGAGAVAGHLMGTPAGRRFRDSMLRWAVMIFIFGAAIHADNIAHGGGLVAGAALAWLFDPQRTRRAAYPGLPAAPVLVQDQGLGLESALLVVLVAVSFGFAALSRDTTQATVTPDAAGALFDQGVTLLEQGDNPGAAAVFRRLLPVIPDEPAVHHNLALALLRERQFADAAAEARQATALDPTDKEGYLILADALDGLGQPAEAAAARRKAAAIPVAPTPTSPQSWRVLRTPG